MLKSMTPQPTRIRSVTRAVHFLLYLARTTDDGGKTARELARDLGWPVATTHHLLNTLIDEDVVSKDANRRYYLGPTMGALAEAYMRQTAPPEHQLHELRRLARLTGETAYISAWRHGAIVVLSSVLGRHAVRVSGLHTGFHGCAHARASGKLLLALARPGLVAAYLDVHPLERVTARTVTDRAELLRELERIRERGYSIENEEFREGVGCAAAPITSQGEVIACFTVSAPIDRFALNREDIVAGLRETAQAASRPSSERLQHDRGGVTELR